MYIKKKVKHIYICMRDERKVMGIDVEKHYDERQKENEGKQQ